MNRILSSYLREIAKTPILSKEEESVLVEEAKQGNDKALKNLIKANLRFVVSVAKHYRNQGVPFNDLIATGNLGLMEAMKHFDVNRGVKFISYAVHWIKQSIMVLLASQSKSVRLPLNQAGLMIKISRCMEKLEKKQAKIPTPSEIAKNLKVECASVDRLFPIYNYPTLSLDQTIGSRDEDSQTLLDFIPSPENILDYVCKNELQEEVSKILDTLQPREAKILRLYFGIGQDRAFTLEEIGSVFNLSRERVRQLKERALKRLRNSFRRRKLYSLYESEQQVQKHY